MSLESRRMTGLIIIVALLVVSAAARAGELIVGEALDANSAPLTFRIIGESVDDVMGGEIVFGDAHYRIDRVSQRGMIGAVRSVAVGDTRSQEFVVFSSSFSGQTAVGNPWVAARSYHHCDRPYNSFLAVYHVSGTGAVAALGDVPYASLTDDVRRAGDSQVYCFTSAPPPAARR